VDTKLVISYSTGCPLGFTVYFLDAKNILKKWPAYFFCVRHNILSLTLTLYLSLSLPSSHHSLKTYIHTIYIIAFQSRLAYCLKYQLLGYAVVKSLSPTFTFDTALSSGYPNLSLYDNIAGRNINEYTIVTISVRCVMVYR